MDPVKIAGRLGVVESVASLAVFGGAAAYAGHKVHQEWQREPGDPPVISKGEFAAYMIGSALVGGAMVLGAKTGALDGLAHVANDATRSGALRTAAAVGSGAAMGAGVAAMPGMLLATGWGWIALAGDD